MAVVGDGLFALQLAFVPTCSPIVFNDTDPGNGSADVIQREIVIAI